MENNDNLYYYIAYGLILLTFFIVLKAPKKSKDKDKKEKNNQGH